MNQDYSTQTKHLSIDVEQWRRDISIFAETTSQALSAIISELSGSCSTGFVERQATQATDTRSATPVAANPPASSLFNTTRDDRLEKLKSQLERRISG